MTTNFNRVQADALAVAAGGLSAGGAPVTPNRAIAHTALTGNNLTAAESGALIIVTAANQTLNLPATVAGLTFRIALAAAGLSAAAGLAISPTADDRIIGNGFTPADNKDVILAGADDRAGDAITLVGDGADGWYVTAITGTWTREA